MNFCRQCGTEFTTDSRFCGTCGAPRGDLSDAAAGPALAPPAGVVAYRQLAGSGDERRATVTFLGAPDPISMPVTAAATSRPSKAWSATVSGGELSEVIDGSAGTFATWFPPESGTSAHFGHFDISGKLTWSVDFDTSCDPYLTSSDDAVLCVSTFRGDPFVAAFDAESGRKLWTSSVGTPVSTVPTSGGLLVQTNENVLLRDLETGKVIWTRHADRVSVNGDVVVVDDGGDLARIDQSSGKSSWTDSNALADSGDGLVLIPGTTRVAVSDAHGLSTYDAESGDRVGRHADLRSSNVLPMGSRFAVTESTLDDDGDPIDSTLTIVDDDREVAHLDGDVPGVVLDTGTAQYLFSSSGGEVHDQGLKKVTRLPDASGDDDVVLAVDSGFYVNRDGEVSYVSLGGKFSWTRRIGSADEVSVGDKSLFVSHGSELTRYE